MAMRCINKSIAKNGNEMHGHGKGRQILKNMKEGKGNTKVPAQPSMEEQALLNDILGNSVDEIKVRNETWRFRWLTWGAKRKITDIYLNEKNEDKVAVKCIAAARVNGWIGMKLIYPLMWRWMYYVKQYTYEELIEAVALVKKKAPLAAYLITITSLTEMKDTMMQMTRQEAERIRQERLMARLGQLEKSTKD